MRATATISPRSTLAAPATPAATSRALTSTTCRRPTRSWVPGSTRCTTCTTTRSSWRSCAPRSSPGRWPRPRRGLSRNAARSRRRTTRPGVYNFSSIQTFPEFLLISPAYAQAAIGGDSGFIGFLPIILMFVLLYFLMIRPQMKRAKETKAMIEALQKGDEVVTAGGIVGRITKLGEQYVTVEVAPNTELVVQRSAVQVSSAKSTVKVDPALVTRVEGALQKGNVAYRGILLDQFGVRVRFADTDTQLRAKDVIDRSVNPDQNDKVYSVALNLLSASPDWLSAIHALPMYLGLDLRGRS